MKYTAEQLENFWRDPANWRGGIYRCAADPRVIVSKRIKWMGWTINFAHRSAWPVLLVMLLMLAGPYSLLVSGGMANARVLFGLVVADIAVICLVCWYFASPKRYE
jgi:hypothetical protein